MFVVGQLLNGSETKRTRYSSRELMNAIDLQSAAQHHQDRL